MTPRDLLIRLYQNHRAPTAEDIAALDPLSTQDLLVDMVVCAAIEWEASGGPGEEDLTDRHLATAVRDLLQARKTEKRRLA